MRKLVAALAAASALMLAQPLFAQDGPAKIALIHGMTGSPLEAYTKQEHVGIEMGFEYATKGTMTIKGRKIELVKKDDQFKPDIARSLLAEAYADEDVVLAMGSTSSGVTLAMLPVALENEKILFIDAAVADGLTGKDSNRFVFKTSRNSSMDMQAQALALKPDKDLYVATLAQDYAFGRDGVAAFKTALEGTGANLVTEEYVEQKATDFTAPIERLTNALKDKPGRKVIVIYVAGIDAMTPLVNADLGRHGIEISTGGNILPALAGYKKIPGMEGAMYYYYEAPKNPVNDWLVAEHQKRFNAPPDFFTAGGFAAAMAVAKALETAPDWETESLITTMEGMSFDSPKGTMTIRKEDHQALQSMYHFKIKVDDNVAWAIPELVREIKPEEMKIPVGRDNSK